MWTETAKAAFIQYIEQGKGGWIGFHHATLLGEFDGFQMWPWFHQFMGGVRFKNYIASFVTGTVTVEDASHPVMKDVRSPFVIENEEWYTYDTSPRPNVHVLASVDEKTYTPSTDIKMGDHPGGLDKRTLQGQERLYFHGSPSAAVRQPNLHANFQKLNFLGRWQIGESREMRQYRAYAKRRRRNCLAAGLCAFCAAALLLLFVGLERRATKEPAFKVLAFYSTDVEPDHVHTAKDALGFLSRIGRQKTILRLKKRRTGPNSMIMT